MIYFIQAEGVGNIKIGYAGTDAELRMSDLQTGSPVKLVLLGTIPGDRSVEADLHRRFSFAHCHGEWFRPVPELLRFIGASRPDAPPPGDVIIRYVQIKVLTINNRQATISLFKQLPEQSPLDWSRLRAFANAGRDIGDIEPGDVEWGIPWGLVYQPLRRNVGYLSNWLVFEGRGTLYRWPLSFVNLLQELKDGWKHPRDGSCCPVGYIPANAVLEGTPYEFAQIHAICQAARARYEAMDQLFIAV